MRDIKKIIIHCSATSAEMDIGAKEIAQWHKDRGWSDIGYHFVIRRDGTIEHGRPVERPGAHARHHNNDSIGICLVGGINESGEPDSNFTFDQIVSLKQAIDNLTNGNEIQEVIGHRDLPGVDKACPCFDVKALLDI